MGCTMHVCCIVHVCCVVLVCTAVDLCGMHVSPIIEEMANIRESMT